MVQDEVRAQSSGWFVAAWVVLGVVSFVVSSYGSAMIVYSFDQPTHCHYESPCSMGTMLSQSVYTLCCLWCSFLGSGAVSMMVGQSAARRTMRAIASGVAVYAVGLVIAFVVLTYAIDGTHPR